MSQSKTYSLTEIGQCLKDGNYPISGITELGSTEFHFKEPSEYLGVALHNGSRIRPELFEAMEVKREDRFREEDPYTDYFLHEFPIQVIARDSRFEYDLNWEIEQSIYSASEKKWGLQVWNRMLTPAETESTYGKYREFHALLDLIVSYILEFHSTIVMFDIHSFCYQRESRLNWWEDDKPDINLGTKYINRGHFSTLIDLFIKQVSEMEMNGYSLRVGENVLFPGGYLTRKYANSHNRQVLVLAIEYKKIFMDEWTGELFPQEQGMLIENLLLTKESIVRTMV